MPRKNKGSSKKKPVQNGRMVRVEGPGGFRLDFPIPKLPSWLGAADRLSANAAIYPRVDLDMPITISTITIASGATATVIGVDPNVIVSSWSSRFTNLFREYCVVGLRLENTLTSVSNAGGVVLVFVDETLATAPNAGSLYIPHMEVVLVPNPDGRTQLLEYMPSGSYTDLQWTPTTATVVRQWLKFYASVASTGTQATGAGTIAVRGTIRIAFRGYSNF